MFEWMKFTFGSYFSNKTSKEGHKRSFWNVIFALFILLIVLTAFLSTGFNYSFSTHYSNATKYKDFLYNAFTLENDDERVNIMINERTIDEKTEKYASAFLGNDSTKSVVINSFENQDDNVYVKNGYNLIVDTRSSYDTYFAFDIDVYRIDDENQKISFYTYKEELSSTERANYYADLENPIIKNEVVDLTDDLISTYRNYIESVYVPSLSDGDDMLTLWNEIKDVTVSDPKYKNYIYEYYLKAYVGLSFAPNNQYYYQLKYAAYDENYNYIYKDFFIVTDTWCLASFVTDKGVRVTYDGYYDSLVNGFVVSTSSSLSDDYVKANVDTLILSSYTSVNALRTILIGMQVISYFPTILIAMSILALLIFCFCKLKSLEYGFKFVGAFKVVSSYLIISSAISGIITLVLAFITSNQVALSVGLWALLGLISIRVFVLVLCDWIKIKKDPLYVSSDNTSVVDLQEDSLNPLDLSNVETGTKIIVNDDDDDDDLEKMELM